MTDNLTEFNQLNQIPKNCDLSTENLEIEEEAKKSYKLFAGNRSANSIKVAGDHSAVSLQQCLINEETVTEISNTYF